MDDAARSAFNIKVLKRHDATIERIVASASFVVLYSHRDEWVRTTSTAPLRSEQPQADTLLSLCFVDQDGHRGAYVHLPAVSLLH